MLDSQHTPTPKFPQSESWSIDGFDTNNAKSTRIIRKFISSAIYVEKPILEMPPARKTSPYFLNSNSYSDFTYGSLINIPETNRTAKIIKCSCCSAPKNCPCHKVNENGEAENKENNTDGENVSESTSSTNSSSEVKSQVTVKYKKMEIPKLGSELRLSITSLNTQRTGDINPEEKEKIIKNWLKKKDEERKLRDLEDARIREAKDTERQLIIEKERENFKKWLAEKRSAEEKKKHMKEKEEQETKLREAQKEKREVENELNYHIWLRRKKRIELEKKIKEKLTLLQIYEDKQRRIEQNEMAFEQWLQNSKNKPKPIPLNQGLKSLCSSTSVTYINPIPWTPNIEAYNKNNKPTSQ